MAKEHFPLHEYGHGLEQRIIDRLSPLVDEHEAAVRGVLPATRLPDEITYAWVNEDSGLVVPGLFTGGFAYAPGVITIAVDAADDGHAAELQRLNKELKSTVFHEGFHLAQDFTGVDEHERARHLPLWLGAVMEGQATLFERDFANTERTLPYYGNYHLYSDTDLASWFKEIHELDTENPDYDLWRQWKFFHEEYGVNHIMYKVGAWLNDRFLDQNQDLTVVDLLDVSPKEIISSTGL